MKSILEFNLPEESDELEFAIKGSSLCSFISEIIFNDLRGMIKYETENNYFTADEAEKVREYLLKKIEEENLISTINKYFG